MKDMAARKAGKVVPGLKISEADKAAIPDQSLGASSLHTSHTRL
jgi:hypothetical protein